VEQPLEQEAPPPSEWNLESGDRAEEVRKQNKGYEIFSDY